MQRILMFKMFVSCEIAVGPECLRCVLASEAEAETSTQSALHYVSTTVSCC